MRTISVKNAIAKIDFDYDEDLVFQIKRFQRHTHIEYNKNTKSWIVYLNRVMIVRLLEFAVNYGFSIDESSVQELETMRKAYKKLRIMSTAIDSQFNLDVTGGVLMPFQRAGIEYATTTGRCLIADEMGLGKTIQGLGSVEYLNAFPCLIVTPKSLRYNWEDEVNKWFPHRSVGIIKSAKDKFAYDFNIVHYDMIGKYVDNILSMNMKSMICDEAHYLINENAKRTKSVMSIARKIEKVFLLTGTPVVNYVYELVSMLNILGKLPEFGGKINYIQNYCDPKVGYMGRLDKTGAKNIDQLNKTLRSCCYVRRLKKDVLTELPDKTRTIIKLEIDNKDDYKHAENDIKSWLKQNIHTKFYDELKDLSDDEYDMFVKHKEIKISNMEFGEHLVRIENLKQLAMLGKMNGVFEWVDDFLKNDQKLILFASHKKSLELLLDRYKDAAHILADDDDIQKRENKKRFNDDPNCKLIICAMGTSAVNSPGGIGHNLIAASNVAFVEFGWNPSIHDQAEDRAHRIGQKDAVNCWYLVGKNTIDEKIIELIEKKRAVINAAANDGIVRNTNVIGELIASLTKN